jgi:hypothetical protein
MIEVSSSIHNIQTFYSEESEIFFPIKAMIIDINVESSGWSDLNKGFNVSYSLNDYIIHHFILFILYITGT